MVYWSLVFKVIEFVSTLVFFKLFIYEEITQAGTMYCFMAANYTSPASLEPIKQLTYYHGINPGKQVLKDFGILCPWGQEGFRLFFQASEQGLRAFS